MTAVINRQTLRHAHTLRRPLTASQIKCYRSSRYITYVAADSAAQSTYRESPAGRLQGCSGDPAAANTSSMCSPNIQKVRKFRNFACFLKPYILFVFLQLFIWPENVSPMPEDCNSIQTKCISFGREPLLPRKLAAAP